MIRCTGVYKTLVEALLVQQTVREKGSFKFCITEIDALSVRLTNRQMCF